MLVGPDVADAMTGDQAAAPPRTGIPWFGAALGGLALLAALLPAIGIGGRWLWLDELLSVNFSAQGPWATLVTVLRFDTHPPLYYLQLSLWMLVGRSDAWLMANAILWHVAGVLLLACGAARLHGPRVGLAAGLLVAVSPAAIAYADQVRMYSFMVFLIVWVWYAQARWLSDNAGRLGGLWMLVSQVAVANSQTAGLLMLSGCVTLGGLTVLASRDRGRILRWLGIEVAVLVLAAPAIAVGLGRGVMHLRAPGINDALELLLFLTGGARAPAALGAALAILVVCALLIAGLRDRRLILPLLTLVVLPPVLAAVVSLALRPLWIERVFVTVIPFLCLLLARAAFEPPPARADAPPRWSPRAVAFAVLALLWGGLALAGQMTREKGDGYRLAALAVQAQARPGDLVLMEAHYPYWCFLWYFAGPRWGDARQAFILNEAWERMMRRLPDAAVAPLGLGERDIVREVRGVTVALWDRRRPMPEEARAAGHDIFMVRIATGEEEAAPLPGRRLATREVFMPVAVERWIPLP